MILQALTQYYDALNARGEIDAPGWGRPKISYAFAVHRAVAVTLCSNIGKEYPAS